ncbi:hypothetical protein, partial [Streptomyces sp. sk226]
FRVSLSSGSNVTRLFFVPFPVRIRFPVACGVALAFRLIRLYQKLLGLKELPGEDSIKGESCGSAEWK